MTVYDILPVAVLLCQDFVFADNINTGPTRGNKDFLEIIKQDLRRNNDDYKEVEQKNNSITHPAQKINKKIENKTIIANRKMGFRRNDGQLYKDYDYEERIEPIIESQDTKNSTIISLKIPKHTSGINVVHLKRNHNRFSNHNRIFLPTFQSSSSTIKDLSKDNIQFKNIPKFVNKNKISKFKQFMKKNKELLKNFMSSKLQTQSVRPKSVESSTVFKIPKLRPGFWRGKMKNIQRAQVNNGGELPHPELLDMAPAKGGRIHKQRIKGRLCHRHVLVPEGPKYDSRGRWYLPAHALLVRRAYNATRAPRLLLPRCCNCCKKSALGCE